jgi:hypothetical protein
MSSFLLAASIGCSAASGDSGSSSSQQNALSCDDVRITCPGGTHCEMKGINGGAVPACIQDPTTDPRCPAAQPAYGDACSDEGLACTYMHEECKQVLPLDVTCTHGKWHWYATGACLP